MKNTLRVLWLGGLVVLLLAACSELLGPRNNPLDPYGENYQGFETVEAVDEIVAVRLEDSAYEWLPEIRATQVNQAVLYEFLLQTGTGTEVWRTQVESHHTALGEAHLDAGTYRFRVRAQDPDGNWGAWSDFAGFEIEGGVSGFDPPHNNNIEDPTPLISWNSVPGADSYQMQIAGDEDVLPGAEVHEVDGDTFYVEDAVRPGDHRYWRVRAKGEAGYTAWSAAGRFFYEPPWHDHYFRLVQVVDPGDSDTFDQGSTTGDADESPVNTISLTRPFAIGEHEFTNGQAVAILNEAIDRGLATADSRSVKNVSGDRQVVLDLENQYQRIAWNGSDLYINPSGYDSHPVYAVTWYGAMAIAHFLNEMEEWEQTVDLSDWSVDFDAHGYRLPTEAEWEYAARGGSESIEYTYSGSNILGTVGYYDENSGSNTHLVGLKAANELGIHDMSGNVDEWVYDWYSNTYYARLDGFTDPEGPSKVVSDGRVWRGGAWGRDSYMCRVSYRAYASPDLSGNLIGFRIALSPGE